ncbi:MAG: glucan biosynthesis protein C [bacterium]|jgi:glucan biosynthesis protein C
MELEKNKTIETLRGLAILLVVVGHVIGSAADGGMKVDNDSFLRYFYDTFIDCLQMPLFTIIAGWVYSLKPATYKKSKIFFVKKAVRIIVPMFVVGVCYFLLQYVTPGTNKKENLLDLWKLLLFPYTLFWYLYSLFVVFVVIALVDVFGKMNTVKNWLLIFCLTVVLLLIRDYVIPYESPNYFSYKGALYLLPCFILGVGLNRFKIFFQKKIIIYLTPILLVTCVIIQQLSWFGLIDYVVHKNTTVGLILGFTGTIMLLSSRIKVNWLIWFGIFAYSIYLFHAFGTAAGRIISSSLNIDSKIVIFIMSLTAGVLLPILTDKILERFKLTRILFLGKQ